MAKQTTKAHMGCSESCKEEILRLIELCLDGELTKPDEEQLMKKIEACPGCGEILSTHQSYKQFMHFKVERKCCCAETKAKILESIDTIEE